MGAVGGAGHWDRLGVESLQGDPRGRRWPAAWQHSAPICSKAALRRTLAAPRHHAALAAPAACLDPVPVSFSFSSSPSWVGWRLHRHAHGHFFRDGCAAAVEGAPAAGRRPRSSLCLVSFRHGMHTGLTLLIGRPEKPKGHHPVSDDGPWSELEDLVSSSAASSARGRRPKKADANNGQKSKDARHTHDVTTA